MRDPLADALVVAERRLLSLERRFRDFAAGSVRYLHQLLDVDITYDGPSAVADGDVLTYDADIERWVNGSGGTGGYATARASGDTTPDSWLDWSEASDPGWTPELYAGGLDTDVVGGIVVTEPGFYDVAVVGVSDDAFTIEALAIDGGWQFAGEDPPSCRQNLAIIEGADAGDGGASGSIQMALGADHWVQVRIVTAGFVYWSLSLELVAPADIVDGSCST